MADYLNVKKFSKEQRKFIEDYQNVELNDDQKEKLQFLLKHHSDSSLAKDMITKAFKFAVKAHEGVKRKSGLDYVTHPIAVAEQLCLMRADFETICAALLHDTIEDVKIISKELVAHELTPTIADLVDGVTKVSPKGASEEDAIIQTDNKLILSIEQDPRIIIIKLIDRWHNMKTIYGHKDPAKRLLIAKQTLDIFVPLARMFSMYKIMEDLEERAFEVIQRNGLSPEELEEKRKQEVVPLSDYEKLVIEREEKYLSDEKVMDFINQARFTNFLIDILKTDPRIKLSTANPSKYVDFKFKSFAQIHRKKQKLREDLGLNEDANISIDDIHDTIKIIINTNSEEDCYRAKLAIDSYIAEDDSSPFFGTPFYVKDYIQTPAFNGYQSIHARYFVKSINKRIQIEYRTFSMRNRALDGIASCWKYDRESVTNGMLDFLKTLPFYEDLKALCGEYNADIKYNPKNRTIIERRLFDGLTKKVVAKRVIVNFEGIAYSEPKGCILEEFLRKHSKIGYIYDDSLFKVGSAYISLSSELQDGDEILRIPPLKENGIQRERVKKSSDEN